MKTKIEEVVQDIVNSYEEMAEMVLSQLTLLDKYMSGSIKSQVIKSTLWAFKTNKASEISEAVKTSYPARVRIAETNLSMIRSSSITKIFFPMATPRE